MRKIWLGAVVALASSVAATAAIAADFSGDWKISFAVGGNPATVNCSIKQMSMALSGHCLPVMQNAMPSDLMGTVDGSMAKWSYDVVFNGKPGHVGYEAKMTSDSTMSGTLSLAGTPTPFTAEKQ